MKKLLIVLSAIGLLGSCINAQSINRSDTIYKINPIVEMKKGVIIQSCALAVFGGTTVAYLVNPPITTENYLTYGIMYGTLNGFAMVGKSKPKS